MCNSSAIEHDLLSALNDGINDDTEFNAFAHRVFQYQFKNNQAYHQHCKALGISPENINHWYEIPAIPTDVFKFEDYPLVTFPLENKIKTFLTSGTTLDIKGQHHFPSLELYESSIIHGWSDLDLPCPQHPIFLTASPESAQNSSLSHMMGILSQNYAKDPETALWAIDSSGNLDVDALTLSTQSNKPLALLGTAIAFLHLFENLDSPLQLPSGSWAMETGGYKGTSRSLLKSELYQLFEEKLGLTSDSIINEYSMTELSSQFYTRGLGKPHTGPSWTRIRVIDPLSDTDALPNNPGHLVIYDLANLHSVMAIRTQDIAVRSEADLAEGNNSFTLLGRDPSALPRGCSRAADQSLRS